MLFHGLGLKRDSQRWDIYSNGRLAADRAFIFANPAADAHVPDHMRKLQFDRDPIPAPNHPGFQLDGFLRQRAHFFADNAGLAVGPGNAAALINVRLAEHRQAFLIESEGWNRFNRTDLPAGVAGIITITQAWNQHWSGKSLQASFKNSRLQRAGWTGADTLITARATCQGNNIIVILACARRS